MPAGSLSCMAVVVGGPRGSALRPLTSDGTPGLLLPVANRPLLSFLLRGLEEAGISEVLVLCEGEAAVSAVSHWLAARPRSTSATRAEALRVPDGASPCDALRCAKERLRAEHTLVVRGDLLAAAPLADMVLAHRLRGAMVTALLASRRTSPASETKPGQAPKGVDYVGLAGKDGMAYFLHAPDRARGLRLPTRMLEAAPALDLRTSLVAPGAYAFRTDALLDVLTARSDFHTIEDHVLPYMTRRQLKPAAEPAQPGLRPAGSQLSVSSRAASVALPLSALDVYGDAAAAAAALAGLRLGDETGGGGGAAAAALDAAVQGSGAGATRWACRAFAAPQGSLCSRLDSLSSYVELNREVVAGPRAAELLREQPNAKYDNFVRASVQMGAKATVGAGCMIGEDVTLGDKSTVKRSVIGPNCVIGTGVKIINSVLLANVTVEEGCHVQGSIVCNGARIGAGAVVRDCQVGPDHAVGEGADIRDEILDSTQA